MTPSPIYDWMQSRAVRIKRKADAERSDERVEPSSLPVFF
jgi:hypothetical protein